MTNSKTPSGGGVETPNFRLLIDSTPALIHTSLPDGYLDFFNQTWLQYVGRSLEDLQGWKWTAAIHPDDVEGIVQEWRASLATGEAFLHEARVRRADGEYRWMLHHKVALRDEHGEIVKWYGSSIDIEDRKRAEEELRAAMSERARLAAVRAEIGMALARKDNLKGILDSCAKTLVRNLDATFARIWTLSRDGRELELQASAGIYTRLDGRYGRIPFGKFKIGSIAQARKPHVTNDVQNDPRVDDHEWARAEKMTSFAGYPLVVEDRVVGVMGMFSRKALNQGTIDTLSFIADSIAQSIERKHAEDALQRGEFYLAEGERLAHTGSWALNPSGFFEHWSRELFQIYGLDPQKGAPTLEQFLATVHPQDREFMAETIKRMHEQGSGCDVKKRIIRADGAIRYVRCVGIPVLDNGVLKGFLGTAMDVTEQEELTQELQRREAYLAKAQRLSQTGSFGWKPDSGEIVWSDESYRIFEYDAGVIPTLDSVVQRVHPEDRADFQNVVHRAFAGATDFEHTYRLLLPDGRIKHVHALAHALQDTSGNREFVGAAIDVTSIKRADEKLREREAELRQVLAELQRIVDLIPQHIVVMDPGGNVVFANRQTLEYTGLSLEEASAGDFRERLFHPEDVERLREEREKSLAGTIPFQNEQRVLGWDGKYRWFLIRYNSLLDESGQAVRWYCTATDIEDLKLAENKLRQDEREMRQLIDHLPQWVLVLDRQGVLLQANETVLDYYGRTLEEMKGKGCEDRHKRDVHSDDLERTQSERAARLSKGLPFELEKRLLGKDGRYRWFLFRYKPVVNEGGDIVRWFATATDIEERKHAEERTRNENLALREQIDRDSMFEDIVGSSDALRIVLRQVAKVAPSNSTVLILGETGTGKELVARAIHKHSGRSERALIGVNCAAIPPSLIASELFGHEKGAFTGATQRRVGRFESANGGTIFLDEVGDLPPEIQIALLRVLQEHEIERVGSNKAIPVDVRVLAATHRNLDTLVAEGKFREDLLYRLNVVPIQMPALRERADDIPVLVDYFIGRFGKKAGKKFRTIEKKTTELFKAYPWPGNVRELQNVIERAVILSEGDTFCVDETWLKRQAPQLAGRTVALTNAVQQQEKEMIEAALAESAGRVAGPGGAAGRLGIPRATLDAKIRRLGINRYQFRGRSA